MSAKINLTVAKSAQFTVRLPETLRREIDHACDITGLDAATLTRACLAAFVDYVRMRGQITLPLEIVPRKTFGDRFEEIRKEKARLDEFETQLIACEEALQDTPLDGASAWAWRHLRHAQESLKQKHDQFQKEVTKASEMKQITDSRGNVLREERWNPPAEFLMPLDSL